MKKSIKFIISIFMVLTLMLSTYNLAYAQDNSSDTTQEKSEKSEKQKWAMPLIVCLAISECALLVAHKKKAKNK